MASLAGSHDLEAICEEPPGSPDADVSLQSATSLPSGNLRSTVTFAAGMEVLEPHTSSWSEVRSMPLNPSTRPCLVGQPDNLSGTPPSVSYDSSAVRHGVLGKLAQLRQEYDAPVETITAPSVAHTVAAEQVPADAETAIAELCNSFRVLSEALGDLQREVSAHKILAKQQTRKCEDSINLMGNELAELREKFTAQAVPANVAQNIDWLHSSIGALTERVTFVEQVQGATVREHPATVKQCEAVTKLGEQVNHLRTVTDELKRGQAELGQDIGDIVGVMSHSNIISGQMGGRGAGTGGSAGDGPMSTGGTAGADAPSGSGQADELGKAFGEHRLEHSPGTGDEGWAAQQIRELAEMLDMERRARASEVEELRASFLSKVNMNITDVSKGDPNKSGMDDAIGTEMPAALVALHMALAKELRTRAEASEAAAAALRAEMRSELSQRLTTVEEVLLRVVSMAESVRNDAFVDRELRRSPAAEGGSGGSDGGATHGGLAASTGATEALSASFMEAIGTPANGGATPSRGGALLATAAAGASGGCGGGVGGTVTPGCGGAAQSLTGPGGCLASRVGAPVLVGGAGGEAPNVNYMRNWCQQQQQQQQRVSSSVAFSSRGQPASLAGSSAASSVRFAQTSQGATSQEVGGPGTGAMTPGGWMVPPSAVSGVTRTRSPPAQPPQPQYAAALTARTKSPVRQAGYV